MTEMLTDGWKNQEWAGEGAAGPELRRPITPLRWGRKGVAPMHPIQEPTAPQTSGITPLLHRSPFIMVPVSHPGHWLLGWKSWDPKEAAPSEGTPPPCAPHPPLGSYF